MMPADIRATWARGDAIYGLWSALSDPFAAELAALSGLDYICLDQQHGLIDYRDLVNALPAIERHGVLPITRVPENSVSAIGRSLDAGAMGVVVPMVNTAKQAAAAVSACRYSPEGTRSFGPIRAAVVAGTSDVGVLGGVLCIVMVETEEGLSNLGAIAETPGVDAIYVGPADLALSLGLQPKLEPTEPRHAEAIAAIQRACVDAGITAGIQCTDGASAQKQAEAGFRMLTFAKDSALLQAAVRRELQSARGATQSSAQTTYT